MHEFYLICPIGTEKTIIKELKIKRLDQFIESYILDKGGVSIKCELNFGVSLCKIMKTPTRILLRLKEQKCRDFPKLYKIISKFDFKPYLVQETVEFVINTSKSRIINTKKAMETCEDAFDKYINANKLKTDLLNNYQNHVKQKIYIRIHEDNLTLSIDCSGHEPFKRSGKTIQGHAPMRENYVSILITELLSLDIDFTTIIDPMCGSGTILREAKDYFQLSNRIYIYQRWPILKNNSEISMPIKVDFKLIGYDRDKSVLKNHPGIEFINEDLFEGDKKSYKDSIVILNPPYGKRIKIKEDRVEYYEKMVTRIKEKFKPIAIGFVAPSEVPLYFKNILSFNNNGIKVNLYLVF